MAQEEIIFKIAVDASDATSNVTSIEEQFDVLRKKIKETESELDQVSNQFGENSSEAEKTRKTLSNLNKSYTELSKAATDVNAKFEDVYGELQPLTTRMGEAEDRLYELALAGKQNTQEYQDLLDTVARYRQTQIETDLVVDSAAQTFSQKLGAAIQGAASGFEVVQGASALFGDESEELEKTLLKVQSAMALAQGIEGVRVALPLFKNFAMTIKSNLVTAFTSLSTAQMINAAETGSLTLLQRGYAFAVGTSTGMMKAFRLALASTGIGLLVVALGFLIEKMMSYFSSTNDATKAQDRFTASVKRYNDAQERQNKKLNDSIKFQLDYAKAVGASEEKIYQIEKNSFQKREAQRESEYWQNLQRIETLKNKKKNALNAENADLVKSINEEITNIKTKNNELIDLKYQLQREEKILTAQHNTDLKKEQNDANEEALKKQVEAGNKSKEIREKQLEEIRQNKIKQQELETETLNQKEQLENEYYDSFKTQQELEEQAVRDKYFTLIETTKDNETLKLAQQKELDAIAQKYKDEKDNQEKERQKKIDDLYEEYYNQYYDATTDSIQKEKDAVEEKYFYLIKKAEEYGLSTVELEKKRVAELEVIAEKEKEPRKNMIEDIKGMYTQLTDAISTSQNIDLKNLQDRHNAELEYLKENYGSKENYAQLEYNLKQQQFAQENVIVERQRKLAEFQKKVAILQTTLDTAQSLSNVIKGATAAANAGGPAAPFLLAGYIATGIGTITQSYAKVKSLLNAPMPSLQAPKMPSATKEGQTEGGDGKEVRAEKTYKVVVVDSDITKVQEKTKKVELLSTI